jgi:hypothetical protein
MSLEVKHYPQDYRTVYNPIEVVVLETSATTRGYEGFSYLLDVYNGSVAAANLIGRLKVPPIADGGFGRFDISGIVESYISSSLIDLNGTNINSAFLTTNSDIGVVIRYGWQHYNGGTYTIDMNQTVTMPDTSTVSETSLISINASLPNYRRDLVNFYDWQSTDYYLKYMPTKFTIVGPVASTKKFLTNSPNYPATYDSTTLNITSFDSRSQKVRLTDQGFIYALHSTDIQYIQYWTEDNTGTINRYAFDIATIISDIKIIAIPIAPASINAIDPSFFTGSGSQPIIDSTIVNYGLRLNHTNTTPNNTMTELFSFKIDTDCRYETRRLEFLNSLGGFDYYNFTKVSRHSEEIDRKFLKANPSDLNTSTGAIDYSISNREKIQYYTKSTSKMKLNSDWVDVATFNWLLELIESPEVYLLDEYTTPTGTTEVRRIPIKNIEGNWEEKVSNTDNIFNLSIDLELSMDNYRQRF